jgi:hypothetical protein
LVDGYGDVDLKQIRLNHAHFQPFLSGAKELPNMSDCAFTL